MTRCRRGQVLAEKTTVEAWETVIRAGIAVTKVVFVEYGWNTRDHFADIDLHRRIRSA